MTEERPPPSAVTDYAEALKKVFDQRRPYLSMGAAGQAWGVSKSTVSRALSGAKGTIAAPELVEQILSFRNEPDSEIVDVIKELPRLRREALRARDAEPDRVALLREEVRVLQAKVAAAVGEAANTKGELTSTKSDNSRLTSEVSSLAAKASALQQRAQQEAKRAAEEQQLRRLEQQRADREAAGRQQAEDRAREAEQGSAESLARFNESQKRLAAAQRYAFESDATIDELRRQAEERDEQFRLLRVELKTLRKQVKKLLREQEQAANAVAKPVTTQVSSVKDRPQRVGQEPVGLLDFRDAQAGSSVAPPAPTPEELLQDLGRPAERRAIRLRRPADVGAADSSSSAAPLGRAEARRARQQAEARKFQETDLQEFETDGEGRGKYLDLLLKFPTAAAFCELMGFYILMVHVADHNGMSGEGRFGLWFVGGFFLIIALTASTVAESSITRASAVTVILCAALAAFGNDTLLIPWLSNLASELGVQLAQK